jgi:uncharacterized repeat protein (TIGR01451 family)
MRQLIVAFLSCFLILALSDGDTSNTAQAHPHQQTANVSLEVPTEILIGETFDFTISFENTSVTTGFGPFIDLILPLHGVDGPPAPDGVDFVRASFMGNVLPAEQLVFPGNSGTVGCVDHPYARNTTNMPMQVCGPAGNKLVVFRLPFGSVVGGQPVIETTVTAQLSPFADPGVPLTIRARGGFEFGANSLNDPCCDPAILIPAAADSSLWPGTPALPVLMRLTKTANAPEDGAETATGPNFSGHYTIRLDVANGQTISNLNVTDFLPSNLAFLSVISADPGGVVVTSPTPGVAHNPPDNELVVHFASVTGGPGKNDVEVVWEYMVPVRDANGNRVLDPNTGGSVRGQNEANAIGDWIPPDTRDSAAPGNATAPGGSAPEHSMWFRSLAVQKSVDLEADNAPTGYSPGDRLQYTLSFQVSDFFTYGDLTVTDILSDGQRFDPGFTPTFAITDRAGVFNGNLTPATYNVVVSPTTGSSRVVFQVSDALIAAGDDGILQGGRAIVPNAVGATGTIIYRAIVQEDFSTTFPSGDPSVDQGDRLNNKVTITGTVRSNNAPGTLLGNQNDDSGTDITIVSGTLEKTIYAVNGSICAPCSDVLLDPGDTVSYRIAYALPASDFDGLSFDDYLPLPTFDATSVTVFNPVVNAGPPAVGQAQFGPSDTFFTLSGVVPVIRINAPANRVTFDYGSYDNPNDPGSQIDIVFTVRVLPLPYADSLALTNFVESNERLTDLSVEHQHAAASIAVRQPLLVIRKSVVGSSNPNVTLTPPDPGGVQFNAPGTPGIPWIGPVINSASLGTNDINSDLSGGTPGDLVRFAIVIQNVGAGSDGAFDIRVSDSLPVGLRIPDSGLNLTVTRGDRSPMNYLGGPADLFAGGIELVDPGPVEGICQTYDDTNGRNIILVIYDLQIDTTVPASGLITNVGNVTQYTSLNNGNANHVGDNQLFSDTATIGSTGGGQSISTGLEVSLTKQGEWQSGAVGVVGDRLSWLITVHNTGSVAATNLVITDVLLPELGNIEIFIDRGTASLDGQTVTLTIPILNPGETVLARINATVMRIPANGRLDNTVTMLGQDASGALLTRSASAVLQLTTTLPATGYPSSDRSMEWWLPAAGLALTAILIVAGKIWKRRAMRVT